MIELFVGVLLGILVVRRKEEFKQVWHSDDKKAFRALLRKVADEDITNPILKTFVLSQVMAENSGKTLNRLWETIKQKYQTNLNDQREKSTKTASSTTQNPSI